MFRSIIASCIAGVACSALLLACQAKSGASEAAPSTEPERFSFALPGGYAAVALRGEGSETLQAPAGARVTARAPGFAVEAGADFAVEIASHAPPLGDFTGGGAPLTRVLGEPDLVVFKSGQGYSFVVVRELVPEWDESERQRFACGSAGGPVRGAATGADIRVFSKSAVQVMVAACRTLELPRLE